MGNRETLIEAMQLPESTVAHINLHGAALANLDTMSQAIHEVYCGVTADHDHPDEKDREQAARLLDAVKRRSGA